VNDAFTVMALRKLFARIAFVKGKTMLSSFLKEVGDWSKISARKQPAICISLRKQERPKNSLL